MIFDEIDQRQRLKWAFAHCKNGAWGEEPDGENDAVCIRAADFDGQLGRLNNGERTLRSLDQKTFDKIALRKGDVIIEKSGGGEKQLVGRAVLFQGSEPSFTSNFLARCRPAEGVDPSFLNYLMLAIYNGRGTYPHIKQSTGIQNLDLASFLDIKVKIPALETQRRIAQFLDEKTARIDGLIEKKRALLDRLAEKRQALITRAVTKGLNPDAPMKPSGIDWLGDIPAHWEVKALKYVSMIGNGSTPQRDNPAYWQGKYPWLNSSVVNLELVSEASDFVTDLALQECHLPRIEPPAVLVGITGQGRTRGMASLLIFEATINQHLAYIKPHSNMTDAAYIRYVITVAYTYLRNESDGAGSTKGAITCEQLAHLRVPVPPCSEQGLIATHVDNDCSRVGQLVAGISNSIERLAEYRSALITAAVTGQIEGLQ